MYISVKIALSLRIFYLGGGGKIFFKFCYINEQHIKIIVLKFEVDWNKTNGDMK